MQQFKRTAYCGEVTEKLSEQEVHLCGWAQTVRDHGDLVFIDLRDRSGIVQLVFSPQINNNALNIARKIKAESVISVKGIVASRAKNAINEDMITGKVEVECSECLILNEAATLPFQLDDADSVDEELKLKYRYLDLRRSKMSNILKLRHDVVFAIREYLNKNKFYEIETPILSKSTPEGARDFLVPSRINPGSFYALPQSPQIYKQILMASGAERYFQIARCFRDEDFRANRQPEFTQVDLEMSFVNEEDVKSITEGILKTAWKAASNETLNTPFPSTTYKEAFDKYGSDKPDLRFDVQINDITSVFENIDIKFLQSIIKDNGRIGSILIENQNFSRTQLDKWVNFAKDKLKAKGLVYIKFAEDNKIDSPISKLLPEDFLSQIQSIYPNAKENSTLFLVAGSYTSSWKILGKLRLELAKSLNLIDEDKLAFTWVTDFPLFEWDENDQRWYSTHHPFTAPAEPITEENLSTLTSRAYDIVCNGEELGGGSIRIHDPKEQAQIFDILNISKEDANNKFGFLLKAQTLGFPPQGGLALGLDRIIMTLAKTSSIRDVIPFPKTSSGYCPMIETPNSVDEVQLKDLHIKLIHKTNK